MCPTRERREAAYNLLKFSALCYFSKQKNESAVTGLETWALCIQAEAFFFFLIFVGIFPVFWTRIFLKIPMCLQRVPWDGEEGP